MPSFPNLDQKPYLKEQMQLAFSLGEGREILLGPIDAYNIRNDEVAAELFDTNNSSFKDLLLGRSLIVGRRGAGKSALLNTYRQRPLLHNRPRTTPASTRGRTNFDQVRSYDLVVEIVSHSQLEAMQTRVRNSLIDDMAPSVETLSECWRNELWVIILHHMKSKLQNVLSPYSDYRKIEEFLAHIFLLKEKSGTNRFSGGMLHRKSNPPLDFDIDRLEQAVIAAQNLIRQRNMRCAILFDSMEEYQLSNQGMNYALKGLLRCIWEHFNQSEMAEYIQIKFCLPAEIYNYSRNISSNRSKDFQSVEFIRWTPLELFRIAAHRYAIALYLYDRKFFENNIQHIDLSHRSGVHEFWSTIIPGTVKNHLGQLENVLAYIARHTQLLPRQILQILNVAAQISYRKTSSLQRIESNSVSEAISVVSQDMVYDILGAFTTTYPKVQDLILHLVCPRLSVRFSFGELDRVWRQTARNIMEQMQLPEFYQFWNMLFELGLFGRVENESIDENLRYIVGTFTYNEDSGVQIGEKDEVCVHPLLLKYLRGDRSQVVYPRGSGIK
jgi:hypothetical protein